jgi:hypothetical protein
MGYAARARVVRGQVAGSGVSITLVLGSADCLHADIERARDLIGDRPYRVIACNQAVFAWPGPLAHFVTAHPEEMGPWLAKRAELGYSTDYETWTRPYPYGFEKRERLCDHVLGGIYHGGSSGLLALGVAIETGGTRNILCGIPMDTRPHFNAGEWTAAAIYRTRWEEKAHALRRTARSWSGWTAELLGEPDAAWLTASLEEGE